MNVAEMSITHNNQDNQESYTDLDKALDDAIKANDDLMKKLSRYNSYE